MSKKQALSALQARHLILMAALGATLAPTSAMAEDEVERLTNPDTTEFSFGLAHSDEDNQRFGMYNGLDEAHGYAIGSINIIRRDDETGTWMRVNGRNLGLSTAEFGAEYERQGEWRIGLEHSLTPRVTPYDINTGLENFGSNEQTINGVPLRDINIETNRYKTRLELARSFSKELEFKMLLQHENKQGERLFGKRLAGNLTRFAIDPVDYQMRMVDMVVNYTGEKFQLSGGYNGSFFSNKFKSLDFNDGDQVGLPPDNSAHQFSLLGAYQFTPSTRAKLKLSHTRAIQDDVFMDVGVNNISGRDDLGGRVDTTLVDLGLTMRPLQKLNVSANLRYEDRNDRTTVAQYITPNASTDGFNEPRSLTVETGRVEATYQLPQGFSLNGGLEAERKDRTMAGVRVVGYRSRVEEVTARLGLRRAIADTLSGALGVEHSNRTGSDFRTLRVWNAGAGTFGADYVAGGLLQPVYMADRERDKAKLALDWMPTDALSFQFNAEKTWDDYEAGRQEPADVGVRDGDSWLLNVDATYVVNDNWKLSAWASRNVTNLDQATCRDGADAGFTVGSVAECVANLWSASLSSRSDAVGFGARGTIRSKLKIGADLTYVRDHNEYDQEGIGASSTAADLPDITSYLTTLKLFANYPVGKESSVQLDYTLDHRTTDDWTWTDWTYTDGTTIAQDPNETTHFLGVSFRYGFR